VRLRCLDTGRTLFPTEMGEPKAVGVLGGMGPAATVEFFRRVVAATPATVDQGHLRVVIDNDPSVPDRARALLYDGPTPVPALVRMVRRLEAAGAGVLAMPCNTAHAFLPQLREAASVPFLDMIDETVRRVSVRTVGLLATSGTIRSGIYGRAFAARGIELLVPNGDGQRTVVRAIEAIKAARSLGEVETAMRTVVDGLRTRGAEAVVAGCTEISLLDGDRMSVPWIDALDVLVEATVREAFRGPASDQEVR